MKNLKFPALILAIGLVVAVAASLLVGIVKDPVITEQEFNFTVTYKLRGETKTLEGIYRSAYYGHGEGADPLDRFYYGSFVNNPRENHSSAYTIAQKEDLELCIVFIFSDHYLMGDAEEGDCNEDPYLAVFDKDGAEYNDVETIGKFGAEIVSWEYPEPVENTFVFTGFSHLYVNSMLVMLAVGALVIGACLIFVKKGEAVAYKSLDNASVVLNFMVALGAIPFMTLLIALMQLTYTGDELFYQLLLCLPALTAFTVAASVALRRKGFTATGFYVQFAGPVAFVLLIGVEAFIYNVCC